MSKIFSGFYVATAYYDVAMDGGAIGSINLFVPLPNNIIVSYSCVTMRQVFTSATNGATIAIGWISTSQDPVTDGVKDFFGGTGIGSLLLNTPSTQTLNLNYTDGERNILLTIDKEDLTGGKMQFDLFYVYRN